MTRDSPFQLPTFDGYTVDPRLKQFRKAVPHSDLEFIDFDSEKGRELLEEMRTYFLFLYED